MEGSSFLTEVQENQYLVLAKLFLKTDHLLFPKIYPSVDVWSEVVPTMHVQKLSNCEELVWLYSDGEHPSSDLCSQPT